jgi:hypothetical protein
MPHPKRELSGTSLQAMTPGIEFGREASVDVFSRLHHRMSHFRLTDVFARNITYAEIKSSIDALVPMEDGVRDLSGSLDFDDIGDFPRAPRTPSMVIAELQLLVWNQPKESYTLGENNADIWHAIQHLEYVSTYVPVNAPEPVDDDSPSI